MMENDHDNKARLLAFAGQIGASGHSPEETARNRGWLDDAGEVTGEGRKALVELEEQAGTRSVFR